MDELSDAITAGKSKIEELTAEISDNNRQVAATQQELKGAKDMREKEHAEWKVSDKEDKDAKALVLSAKDVLANFYADNGLMPAQVEDRRAPFDSEAGKAPPPPPSTWEAPYGGRTE